MSNPAHGEEMEAARILLQNRFGAMGLANILRLQAGGQPTLYGEWLGAEGRRIRR